MDVETENIVIMEPIKCFILKRQWWYRFSDDRTIDIHNVVDVCGVPEELNDEWNMKFVFEKFKEWYKWHIQALNHKPDIKNLFYTILPSPTTFPKFTNETPFTFEWNRKLLTSPKIICHRWNGAEWTYQFENIGHKSNFYEEKLLTKI